jgi:hypothetical protein
MRSAEAITMEAPSLPSDERAALVLRRAESLDEEQKAAWASSWTGGVCEHTARRRPLYQHWTSSPAAFTAQVRSSDAAS